MSVVIGITIRFEYSAKWKARGWKSSKFDQTALEKTPSFRFWIWCKTENWEWKASEIDSPRFPSFLRTPSFRPRRKTSQLLRAVFCPAPGITS